MAKNCFRIEVEEEEKVRTEVMTSIIVVAVVMLV